VAGSAHTHATTPDWIKYVPGCSPHLRRQGAHRITALVANEDEIASAFWESAGYPQDHSIGRRVRGL